MCAYSLFGLRRRLRAVPAPAGHRLVSGLAASALVGLVVAVAPTVASAATTGAASSAYFSPTSGETITVDYTPQILNAYVAAGHKYSLTVEAGHEVTADARPITVYDPTGDTHTCTVAANAPIGTGCTVGPITATTADAGVWTTTVPTETTWSNSVIPAGHTSPERGRVFTSDFILSQNPQEPTTSADDIDFNLWHVDDLGYLYESTWRDYDGITSFAATDRFGPTETPTSGCDSTSDGSKRWDEVPDLCDPFNEFEADPRGIGLPASAPVWDNASSARKTVFVLPTVATPSAANVTLTRDGSNAYSGTIGADITDYTGQATVQILTGASTVVRTFLATVDEGSNNIAFDGKDDAGDPIAASPLTVKVLLNRAGEIHFLSDDVERWAGGLQIQALTGPQTGEDTLYWDDSGLDASETPDEPGCRPTPIVNLGGIHSTGGVHAHVDS